MAFSFTNYPNVSEILQVPGLLFWGTTNLANEAGWGTLLGFCEKGVFFKPGQRYAKFKEEETGEEIRKILYVGSIPKINVDLKNYNATALGRLFPGLSTGTKIQYPGSTVAGQPLEPYTGRLLFVPDEKVQNPCILFQKAWAYAAMNKSLRFSHEKSLIFSCVFLAARKTSDVDGSVYIGPISEAVLR